MNSINKNITIIGAPGSGKTTIGNLLSKKLNLPFYDVDQYIIEQEGKSIADIFKNGEDFFRAIESDAVKKISTKMPSVISTGGGVVKIAENMEILDKTSIIIFLNRPIENIVKDIDTSKRPLLKDGIAKLYELYEQRYPLYKKYSHYEVINDGNIDNAINKIIDCIEGRDAV